MGKDNTGRGKTEKNNQAGLLLQSLDALGASDTSHEAAHWDEVHPDHIAAVVVAVTKSGGAIMFGRSRKGDVLSITLFIGTDRRTLWFGPETEPEDELEKIVAIFSSIE